MRTITRRLKTESVQLAEVADVVHLVRELEEAPTPAAGEHALRLVARSRSLLTDLKAALRKLEQGDCSAV